MTRIPVICNESSVNEIIERECARYGTEYQPVFMSDADEVIEYLKYELPEIKIFYLSDRDPAVPAIIQKIQDDPWLHYGGTILIHDAKNERQIKEFTRDANIIALIKSKEFAQGFGRLLRILRQNKQIIFQRGIHQHLLKNLSGTFVMDNDPLDMTTYANLLTNYLYNSNLISRETRDKLHVAVLELLINAIEHGNCKISYDEKTRWLEENRDIMDLIREKNKDPAVKARKIHFSYTISRDKTSITIKDEGDGFDWRSRLKNQLSPGLHGMGMQMANIYVEGLRYNDKGNEVSFDVSHQENSSNFIPEIFTQQEEVIFQDGEYIVREGEESDYLYYIVSGKVSVYSKGKLVSHLTPDDMFIGEMSFLLSNKRSATMVAKGRCNLIKITKQAFVNLIKDNPHYGIFLARLLAQRLARLNARTALLNTEYLKLKSQVDAGAGQV
jgi:anti-sigma regulatory factor (Ser/Thr protein kinase)